MLEENIKSTKRVLEAYERIPEFLSLPVMVFPGTFLVAFTIELGG